MRLQVALTNSIFGNFNRIKELEKDNSKASHWAKNVEAVNWRCSAKRFCYKFRKIHSKTSVPEFLFKQVAPLKPIVCSVIKKETSTHVLSFEFCEIFKNNFLTEHLRMVSESD